METSIVDRPASADVQQPQPDAPVGQNGAGAADGAQAPQAGPASAAGTCSQCGAAMAEGQDWCLQCGAGAPGSLGSPGWRPAATVLAVTGALLLGAAAAGYAALSSSPPKARVVVAKVAPPVATVPTATPTPTTPLGADPDADAKVPPLTVKAPSIPLTAPTPKLVKTTPTTTNTNTTSSTTTPSSTETGGTGEEAKNPAIVLDTNAASTYNPYNLPADRLRRPEPRDRRRQLDGLDRAGRPGDRADDGRGAADRPEVGQKLSAVELVTSTPGMTVQVYGANGDDGAGLDHRQGLGRR